MASKQQKLSKSVLAVAVQAILQLERSAELYAVNGATEHLELLLKSGLSVNNRCRDLPEGPTLLHFAALNGHTQTVLLLLRLGADTSVVAGARGTPLHQAAVCGHVSTVKAMLRAGCPVNVVASNGFSVLHSAAQGGNTEVIGELASTGCDINATDNNGMTPLHVAAGTGKVEAALELIRHGANRAVVAGALGTPLHVAALFGHVSTVKTMLKTGCPVDVVVSDSGSVLHAAAQGGNTEVIQAMVSRGCDINAVDNAGMTPLHWAAGSGKTEAALELIRHGANRAVVAGAVGTPLHLAAKCGHVSTVKAMLKTGCPAGVVASNGASVLHAAAKGGNAEVIREVVSAGCDINAVDNDAETPLHLAVNRGNTEALKVLITCGAIKESGVNSIDVQGLTPLHHAVLLQNKDCVRVLLEHGADPRKAAPYIGSPYDLATIRAPTLAEAFNNFLVKADEDSLFHEALRDPCCSLHLDKLKLDRHSAFEKDTFGISQLEYRLVFFITESEEVVVHFHNLSLVNSDNLLLLAAILGLSTFVNNFINVVTFRPSFTAQTVISLVRLHYPFRTMPHLQELVPPDASLNLLHVAVLGLKGRTSGNYTIPIPVNGDHHSLLKSLVTSDSFRHTLHEYLPNGLTPLDLAEKVGLDEAVTIISSAGGRHGIYAMISEEVWLQHGSALLLAHQELMKVASSGALGQQAVQTVISQLPGRTTVEQGTATEESHIRQQKVLKQRPDIPIIITAVLPKVNFRKWEEMGILLQVPTSNLEHLEHSQFQLRDRYRKVLKYWLDHNEAASWRTLLEVLGHFETKQTMDQLTQEVLATEDSAIQSTSTTHIVPFHPAEVGATPPPPSSQLPPQFVSHVVHYVGVHWYNFALHLGISSTILDCVLVEKQGLTSDCCLESLHRWLRHDRDTGGKGREVGVVLEAVGKACGPAAVERIQSSWQSSEVRPTSPTPLLQSTPELAALQELVVPSVAAQWKAIADYLLVSHEKRAAIAASERGQVEVCCRELFNQWLQQLPGTGSLSRTWGVLLNVVREALGPEVANQIKTRLDSKRGAVPLPTPCGSTSGSAVLPQQDTAMTASETAEVSVSVLKRPPADEGTPSVKRRDLEERTSPEVIPTPSPSVDPLRGDLLSSKPTAVLLLKKVVPAIIAQEWLQIGVHLGMKATILKTFKATESHDVKLCCLEMFECWLQGSSGTGDSPRTWSTVLSAVEDSLGYDLADSIERTLLEERRQRKQRCH